MTSGTDMRVTNAARTASFRAALPVRILLIVVAVAALVTAGLALTNLVAVGQFNQATATLTRNIKAADKEDADLATLKASQQQTDAQFREAATLEAALLPNVRSSLRTNTEISRQLTALIERRLAEQQGSSSSGNGTDGSGSGSDDTGAATKDQNNASNGPALTDQQRAQVEQLLRSNQQSTDTSTSTQQTPEKKSDQNQTTKPW